MKPNNLLLVLASFIAGIHLQAQTPYTQAQFNYSVQTNIEYGQATDFAGFNDTLLLDLYKPIGDNNCQRPCAVLVHGGAWIGGSKEDFDIVTIAENMAARGWVVATVNYRLGTQKTAFYEMYLGCAILGNISAPAGYICDSAEVIRANYRGQQDLKGAIRYMKSRFMMDSTDVNNVFLVGQSAGGFVSLAAAFMDDPSEKPAQCLAIADAPTPDADLVQFLPANYSLTRPDLGDINGDLHLGNYDASVQGVGNFFGGMMNFEMLNNVTEWPVLYAYHQGNDVVVHYNYGRLLGRIDSECYGGGGPNPVCQSYAHYPKAYGSKGMNNYLSTLPTSPVRTVDIIENYEYNNDCFDNGHSVVNLPLRIQNMVDLFGDRIALNGNTPAAPPCNLGLSNSENVQFSVYPNPSNGAVTVENFSGEQGKVQIWTSDGKLVSSSEIAQKEVFVLTNGIYFFRFSSGNQIKTFKIVVQQ